MSFFEVGKLPTDFLDGLLRRIEVKDPRIVVGPRVGEDAAVLDMGDGYLVATTDPVTFTENRVGWYGVNVNANDVAAMGAEPRWFFATLLLPEGKAEARMVERIFDDILSACGDLGVVLCGGHTEITAGLDRPILVGQMLGEATKERLVTPDRIVPGDAVLLTKGIAVEGTAILAQEKEKAVSDEMGVGLISKAKGFLDDPGISVVKAARAACSVARIHGMHDPTEGGLATGLREVARAAGCGLRIDEEAVPVFPETRAFCEALGLNPWGLIASGALLIVVDPKDASAVVSSVSGEGISCVRMGEVVPPEERLVVRRGEERFPLREFERDELTKVFL